MGKAIVVASGKGGTGKSMFTANLGVALSKQGQRVVIVDLDIGLRTLDLYLGIENNIVYDINDVLNGVCRIRQAIIKVKEYPGLSFMAASPLKPNGEITPLHVKVLADKLKEKYDYVIFDSPAGVDDGLLVASGGADMGIIILNPEYASIRNSALVEQVLKNQGINRVQYVINKIDLSLMEDGRAPSFAEVTRNIRDKVIGVIEEDQNVHISTNLGVPVAAIDGTYLAKSFQGIALRMRKAFEE